MIPRRAALALPLLAGTARAQISGGPIQQSPPLGAPIGAPAIGPRWPEKPVKLVIPFGAGGPIDGVGRLLAELLRERLGQPFVIDNRPGAGGSLGIRAVVQSPPDGSAFVLTSSSLASIPALYPSAGLDPRSAMTPVSLVADVPTALVVNAASELGDVPTLLRVARAQPGRLTYGSGGVGSSNHLSGALFAHVAALDLTHVSYRGAAPAMTALYAGEIDMVFASTVETLPHVRAGRARLLGVTSAARVPALPDVPAVAEWVPGYVALNWYAIAGPLGLAPEAVARFSETLASLRALPEVKARFAAAGTEPLLAGPAALRQRLDEEVPQWQRVTAAAGIKVE